MTFDVLVPLPERMPSGFLKDMPAEASRKRTFRSGNHECTDINDNNDMFIERNAKILPAVLLAAALVSCSKTRNQGPDVNPPVQDDKKVNITATVSANEPVAKSPVLDADGSGNFSKGDVIGLLVSGKDGETSSLRYEIGGESLLWKDIDVTAAGGKVDFAAVYPEQETTGSGFTFDLSGLASDEEKDLLLAGAAGIAEGSEENINLVFRHAMHRLVVRYTVEDGIDADAVQTSCSAVASCTVDMLTQTTVADYGSMSGFEKDGKEVSFILVPQKSSSVTLKVTSDGVVKTFVLGELSGASVPSDLEGGKQLTVEVKVSKGKIELGNVSISGWENQGTIGGEIIM